MYCTRRVWRGITSTLCRKTLVTVRNHCAHSAHISGRSLLSRCNSSGISACVSTPQTQCKNPNPLLHKPAEPFPPHPRTPQYCKGNPYEGSQTFQTHSLPYLILQVSHSSACLKFLHLISVFIPFLPSCSELFPTAHRQVRFGVFKFLQQMWAWRWDEMFCYV